MSGLKGWQGPSPVLCDLPNQIDRNPIEFGCFLHPALAKPLPFHLPAIKWKEKASTKRKQCKLKFKASRELNDHTITGVLSVNLYINSKETWVWVIKFVWTKTMKEKKMYN